MVIVLDFSYHSIDIVEGSRRSIDCPFDLVRFGSIAVSFRFLVLDIVVVRRRHDCLDVVVVLGLVHVPRFLDGYVRFREFHRSLSV